MSRISKFAETGVFKITEGWGKGDMDECLLNGYRVFARIYEKIVELDYDRACTMLQIPLSPLKYML